MGNFAHEHDTESYISRALTRIGCEVIKLEESEQTHASIVQAAAEHSPDLFLFAKARFKGANQDWPEAAKPVCAMLQEVKQHTGKVVCWLFDLMCAEFAPSRFEWTERVAAACDLFVMTDGYTAPRIPNSLVIRQGVPDDVDQDCAWEIEPRWDVLFLGTPYQERGELRDALARRFGPRFRHENNVRGKELTQLIRSCRICIGPQHPYFPNYYSNRIYVVTGHGGLFAAPLVQGMAEEGWRSGDNFLLLPVNPEQMAAKVEEYVTRHDASQLETIRKRGYQLANTRFTYDERVRQLLAAVAAEPDEPTELDSEPIGIAIQSHDTIEVSAVGGPKEMEFTHQDASDASPGPEVS